ncbi:hypothetical protein OGW18_20855 [Citrobacter sp. CK184]|uniref:hypothetical protein n=1 Tax=unclassified Citrobacter TaxID=2644389 RepID=UPI002576CB4A|nr:MULTISPECIES: hypothetical protein [unclassified Citrobacter]MDM3030182.1 hypothetical protein [Citrobacter sp. CK185]MDM3048750.1 hypothetical protein [Citrobacter sp. CK184]
MIDSREPEIKKPAISWQCEGVAMSALRLKIPWLEFVKKTKGLLQNAVNIIFNKKDKACTFSVFNIKTMLTLSLKFNATI